jgi:hypothetical protein
MQKIDLSYLKGLNLCQNTNEQAQQQDQTARVVNLHICSLTYLGGTYQQPHVTYKEMKHEAINWHSKGRTQSMRSLLGKRFMIQTIHPEVNKRSCIQNSMSLETFYCVQHPLSAVLTHQSTSLPCHIPGPTVHPLEHNSGHPKR